MVHYYCGIEFSPVYFSVVAENPFDEWGQKLISNIFEKTGRQFHIVPLSRYILSMKMHAEETPEERTTTNRIPILIGCTIPSIFPPVEFSDSTVQCIRTEGAAVQLLPSEEGINEFMKLLTTE